MKILKTQEVPVWEPSQKVICTELCRIGSVDMELWRADVLYSKENFSERTLRGYHFWGVPYVRLMQRYPVFAKIAQIPVTWFVEDIAYQMGMRATGNRKGWILREIFFKPLCSVIGLLAKENSWKTLWNGKSVSH
ncbi:hypothetical protein [Herbaspirillum autotrophicum]|uniref:hypothetical protein n=1 Tax=Herbaspirillum autotrophicum TaxID=180195 RepID=UPI00067D59B9|nr:hypothetical protein [Herbaspirillum autotrophicum]